MDRMTKLIYTIKYKFCYFLSKTCQSCQRIIQATAGYKNASNYKDLLICMLSDFLTDSETVPLKDIRDTHRIWQPWAHCSPWLWISKALEHSTILGRLCITDSPEPFSVQPMAALVAQLDANKKREQRDARWVD